MDEFELSTLKKNHRVIPSIKDGDSPVFHHFSCVSIIEFYRKYSLSIFNVYTFFIKRTTGS